MKIRNVPRRDLLECAKTPTLSLTSFEHLLRSLRFRDFLWVISELELRYSQNICHPFRYSNHVKLELSVVVRSLQSVSRE